MVERFDLVDIGRSGPSEMTMQPAPEGEWVRWTDYERLRSEIDALKAQHSAEPNADPWKNLLADCMATPCKYPCLRDDLGDWLRGNGLKWPDEHA